MFLKYANCSSIKNLEFESNWPFDSIKSLPVSLESKKVMPVTDSKLPLGIKLYCPIGTVVNPDKPLLLSHHFAHNDFRDAKFDQLSVIKSLGEQEGVDSPMNIQTRRGDRTGSITPLSRSQLTPSSFAKRNFNNGSMTPAAKKTTGTYLGDEISAFERKNTLQGSKKIL